MNVYKVWDFIIPEEVFPFASKSGFRVKIKDEYIVLESKDKKAFSFNNSSKLVNIQIDSIKYIPVLKETDSYKYTYFKRVAMNTPFVVHKGSYDKGEILKALFGLDISDDDNNEIVFSLEYKDNSIEFSFEIPESFILSVTGDGKALLDSKEISNIDITKNTVKVKASDIKTVYNKTTTKEIYAQLDESSMSSSEYFIEFDVSSKTIKYKTIELTDCFVDRYGAVLRNVKNTDFYANISTFYIKSEDRYLGKDEFVMISSSSDTIQSSPKTRIYDVFIDYDSSIKSAYYNYGFFKSTDKLVPMYAYVSSSYAYISFYRPKASIDSCTFSDNSSFEEVLKIKVQKNKDIKITKDKTAKTELIYNSKDFANKLLKSLKHGFGVFSSELFQLKKYRDKGDEINILFNYKNSKNYYSVDIYDETTRYKIVETKKINGQTQKKTHYFYRTKKDAEYELKNTKTVLNMAKKYLIDLETDSDLGHKTINTFKVGPLTVQNVSSVIMVNPDIVSAKFPKIKAGSDLFARTLIPDSNGTTFYNIKYQGYSDTIYVEDEDGSRISIDTFSKMFNSEVDHYKVEDACAYSELHYKSLSKESVVLEFPISTVFIVEMLNTTQGLVYRVYYKNAYDLGVVEALDYEIVDI